MHVLTHKIVRTILIVAALACSLTLGWGQQTAVHKSSVAELITMLNSEDWTKRNVAYEELRSDPAALRSPKVQAELVDLLDRESKERDAKVREAQAPGRNDADENEEEGEGHGEYVSYLLGTVESFADWSDPRQVCILVNWGEIPDAPSAAEAAARARIAIPCLLQMSKSDLGVNRANAIPVLVGSLAKAKDSLDSGTILTVKQTIVSALSDSDEGVRAFTVHALVKFGTDDMIPALRKVSETDPSPEVHGHSIRKEAAKAIASIKTRVGQH
jgi:hypothetical protein